MRYLLIMLIISLQSFAEDLTNNLCNKDEVIVFGCVAIANGYGNGLSDDVKFSKKLIPVSVCRTNNIFRYVYRYDGEDRSRKYDISNPNEFSHSYNEIYLVDGKFSGVFFIDFQENNKAGLDDTRRTIFYDSTGSNDGRGFTETSAGTCVELKEANGLIDGENNRYDDLSPNERKRIGTEFPLIFKLDAFKEYM